MSTNESFGDLLTRYRKRVPLTVSALADLSSIHRDTIAGWEKHKYAPRDEGTLNFVLEYLNLSKAEEAGIRTAYRAFQAQRHSVPTPKQEQLTSCTCCYSNEDLPFVKQLVQQLRDAQVKVWFAPDDMRGGLPMFDQIVAAIRAHTHVIVVLSEAIFERPWVRTEIIEAWHEEKIHRRYKLFPIRLVDMNTLAVWDCFDADTGTDIAAELRARFIPDFSHWQDNTGWNTAFTRLVDDLCTAEGI